MKAILFFSFLSFACFANSLGNAQPKSANIDQALSNHYDQNYEETQRGLASQVEKAEEAQPGAKFKKSSKNKDVFDARGESGIRFWKY